MFSHPFMGPWRGKKISKLIRKGLIQIVEYEVHALGARENHAGIDGSP